MAMQGDHTCTYLLHPNLLRSKVVVYTAPWLRKVAIHVYLLGNLPWHELLGSPCEPRRRRRSGAHLEQDFASLEFPRDRYSRSDPCHTAIQ